MLSDELALEDRTEDRQQWNPRRPNNHNGTRYLTNYVLQELRASLVLAIDEADLLYASPFCNDFFAMLRGWHNDRALRDELQRLDIVLAASTEPGALIQDLNQSPFNVATKPPLDDFDLMQTQRLNSLHGECLTPPQCEALQRLVNGHPYLTRQALYCVATGQYRDDSLFTNKLHTDDTGPFAEHLRHYENLLADRDDLRQGFLQVLRHGTRPPLPVHHALLGLGLIRETAQGAEPRNQLYAAFVEERFAV